MSPYWSYLLTAGGAFGLYLAGRKHWAGWAVGLGMQTLWVAYGITTRQWGFIVSAAIYGSVYAKNIHAWLRPKPKPAPVCETIPCPPFEPVNTTPRRLDPNGWELSPDGVRYGSNWIPNIISDCPLCGAAVDAVRMNLEDDLQRIFVEQVRITHFECTPCGCRLSGNTYYVHMDINSMVSTIHRLDERPN